VLESQLQSNDTIQLNSASLDFTKDANTALEKEIANALEIVFAQ
jgi:flagellar biosynthesis/type III secretory pathway M-ring protein FliF/YscJ